MSLQATCPDCGTTYRVADAARGKKIRCSRCKSVFTADAAADEGKDGYAITPTPPQAKAAAPRISRKPIVRHDFEDEDEPSFKKNSSSMLPYLLVGVGLLVLLCAGLPIAGYVVWQAAVAEKRAQAEAAEQERAAFERERAARVRFDDDPLGEQARQRAEEAFAKAQADHERFREEMRKRMGEDMQEAERIQKEAQKLIEANIDEQRKLIQKQIEKIGAGNLPLDPFDPFAPQAQREMVQVVSRSIPLAVQPDAFLRILWTADSKQAVVLRLAGRVIGLDQYDVTSGRKLVSMNMPVALALSSIRDVSPDGKYYLCNLSGTSFSIWNLPNPRPIVENWKPAAVLHKGVPPDRHGEVTAYLLNGSRLLTVNDAGQVALWSLPKTGKGKPTAERSFTPEATVARYPAPLVDRGIAISPDRTRLAIFNGSDGFLVLDTATLQLQGVVTSPEDALPATDPMGGIHGVAFSPGGRQLAASILSQSFRPGAMPKEKQLIRWDLKTRQRTARFAERSMKSGGLDSRIAWWGNDHIWVASTLLAGSLISWDKQHVVLDSALGIEEKVCFGNTDGKCWFLVTGPDGKSVLKSVDLPADALQKTDKPLELTKDGIVR